MRHIPVLLHTVSDILTLSHGDVAVDATGGSGGHARMLAKKVGPSGTLLVLDQDGEAVARLTEVLAPYPQAQIRNANFRTIAQVAQECSLPPAQGILFDLGISSEQIEESGRGFSFLRDEPLQMTLGAVGNDFTALDIINTWDESTLADIIYGYGEEHAARRIAQAIVVERRKAAIASSLVLATIVSNAKGGRHGRIHPATKTFQALRIVVNDELGALEEGLSGAWSILASQGRMAMITFHALEARIVKRFLKEKKGEGSGTILTAHALRPTRDEVLSNPRARSASLYALSKK